MAKISFTRSKEAAVGNIKGYFGISLIQATAYDVLVMPTAFICIAVLAASIQPENQQNDAK